MISEDREFLKPLSEFELAEWKRNQETREPSGLWNASNLGMCKRKQYLKRALATVTNPPSSESLGKFYIGNIQEDGHLQKLKDAGYKVLDKDESGNQYGGIYKDVIYKMDAIVNDDIYEVKSQQNRSFWHRNKKEMEDKVQNSHQFQVGVEMIDRDKKLGRIVYIDKENNTKSVFVINMDDELRNKIESRIEEMNQAWADKQVPEAIPEEKWECDAKWCP